MWTRAVAQYSLRASTRATFSKQVRGSALRKAERLAGAQLGSGDRASDKIAARPESGRADAPRPEIQCKLVGSLLGSQQEALGKPPHRNMAQGRLAGRDGEARRCEMRYRTLCVHVKSFGSELWLRGLEDLPPPLV